MRNFKKTGISLLLICMTLMGFGQPNNSNDKEAAREKMAAVKVGYLTEKLNLSEAEASAFWPIYNQEKADIKAAMPAKEEKVKPEDMTDAELEKHIYQKFEVQQIRLDIQKSYVQKYIDVIGVQKVAQLFKAEQDFKKEILQKLKKEQGPNKSHPNKQ